MRLKQLRVSVLFTLLLVCISSLTFAAPPTWTISGVVTTADGKGVGGVVVVGDNGATSALTTSDGSYSIVVSNHWDGTVIPSKAGWLITPPLNTYTNISNDIPAQNYTAYQPKISGIASKSDGTPLTGATITANNGGGNTTTNLDGYYEIAVPYQWSGTVSAILVGYYFADKPYANTISDQTNQDFNGYQPTISGSTDIAGTVVTASGENSVVSTPTYSIAVPYGWNGTVEASLKDYHFIESPRGYSAVTADQTNQDFTPYQPTISGFVIKGDGAPLAGVTIIANGGGNGTITDESGYYMVTVPYNWSGNLSATFSGYYFDDKYYEDVTHAYITQNFIGFQPIISGYIRDLSGEAIGEVSVIANDNEYITQTNPEGYYEIQVPFGWTGAVKPEKLSYFFKPGENSYSNVDAHQNNQDFIAIEIIGDGKYGGGTGDPNNPYQIWIAEQMNEIGLNSADWDDYFVLMDDIDMSIYSSLHYNIIGNRTNPFSGAFDGNGHVIRNLDIGIKTYDVGVFGCTRDSVVKNIGVEDIAISVISHNIGALVGHQYSGIIDNCYSTGSITTTAIEISVATGGLVGNNNGVIVNCYSTSSVVANSGSNAYTGGLAGVSHGIISNSYGTGSVSSSSGNYYSNYSGGLVGWNCGSIIGSYSTGSAGGPGDVAGHGGLVGNNSNTLISCYSTANANCGLVGQNYSYITNCYSTGKTLAGCGLVGQAYSDSRIVASYWDIQSSGSYSSEGGVGLNTSAMRNINTFLNTGWDFANENSNGTSDYWKMPQNGGYPILCGTSGTIPVLDGNGTNEDPYVIRNANDLGMVWRQPAAHYILINDVNLAGIQWNKAVIPAFRGLLDGRSFKIQNLSINGGSFLGLVGSMYQTGKITNLGIDNAAIYATGYYIGGITGNNLGIITRCHWSGTIGGYGVYVGGAAGSNSAVITDCYSTGTVGSSAEYYVGIGGLVGRNRNGVITGCYSTCAVTGGMNSYAGGLAGENSGNIVNSYSSGAVKGTIVGGLIGENSSGSSVTRCYSTGRPSGWISAIIGGLVGENRGSVMLCFWDKYTSYRSTSDGGIGKTTAQMQVINTFLSSGWDFVGESTNGIENHWRLCTDGVDYPRLSWEFAQAGDFACPDGVSLDDLESLAMNWLSTECTGGSTFNYACDANGDEQIDFEDYRILAENWPSGV